MYCIVLYWPWPEANAAMTTGLGLVCYGLGLGVVALITSLYITTSHAIRSAETCL